MEEKTLPKWLEGKRINEVKYAEMLQEELQIIEIVTGDHDEGSLFDGQGDLGGSGVTEAFRVCLVQQCHALEVHFADFQNDGQQLVHTPIIHTDGKERLEEEIIDAFIGIAENGGVVCVSRYTTNAKQNQGFQRTNIFIGIP